MRDLRNVAHVFLPGLAALKSWARIGATPNSHPLKDTYLIRINKHCYVLMADIITAVQAAR